MALLPVRVETLTAGADAVELRVFRKKLRTYVIGNEGTADLAGWDRDITIPFGEELVPNGELLPIPLPKNAGRRMAVDDE